MFPFLLHEQRPAAELVRAVNKFKADFGGHIVSLERVQPSADHVPHRFSTCSSLIISFMVEILKTS